MFTCEIWQYKMAFLLNAFCAFLQYQKDRTFCLQSHQVKASRRSAGTKRRSQVKDDKCRSPCYGKFINNTKSPNLSPIECFHSRGQRLCKFNETKESVCIRKEFNSHRIGLGHQQGRRFIVLGHKYGRRDVMRKHSIHNLQ